MTRFTVRCYLKYVYSMLMIDTDVSGTDVIISMVIPDPTSYEGSAGGPFFRDINRDRGSAYHALYWYMVSVPCH